MSGMPERLVVDGSVLLAWVVETPASARATALLEEEAALLAPESALAEALEAARHLVRDGHMQADDLAQAPQLIMPLLHAVVADAPLMGRAAALATTHGISMPAAAALALAEVRDAALATADPTLARVATEVLGEESVRLLGA